MKVNNPNEIYQRKRSEEAWQRVVNKYSKYIRNTIDNFPEFLKEYPLTIDEVFKDENK